jgi:hypothetical protein
LTYFESIVFEKGAALAAPFWANQNRGFSS